jgi:cytochrome c peroxidase
VTEEKVDLGRQLFYDERLSANGTQSCSSCHQQSHGFSEPAITATGSTGQKHHRNSMALMNVAYNATLTWAHSGINTLEQHMLLPLFGDAPVEMGAAGQEKEILARLRSDATYQHLFDRAFPSESDPVTFDNVVKALASFVRTMISFDAPFDRYAYYGDDAALTPSQVRGMNLFMSERLECAHCHAGFNFSQFVTHQSSAISERAFHVTGLHPFNPEFVAGRDYGLFAVTSNVEDKDRFKAPSLRNIAATAPYMHDGSLATLNDVIDFYQRGGEPHPGKSPFMRGFILTSEEREDLLAFLASLTDEKFLTDPRYADPDSARRLAKHQDEAVRLVEARTLVGEQVPLVVRPTQHVAVGREFQAARFEVLLRVGLVDPVQRRRRRAARAGFRGMIDDHQRATRLQGADDLIERALHVDLRPVAPGIDPVQVVIHLDEEDGIESRGAEIHLVQVDGAVLDVRQAIVRDTLRPARAPPVEGGVVEHQDVTFRADDVAQQFAVIAAAREQIRDLHAGLDAGEAQDVGWVIECVPLPVGVAAGGVRDRGVVQVSTESQR